MIVVHRTSHHAINLSHKVRSVIQNFHHVQFGEELNGIANNIDVCVCNGGKHEFVVRDFIRKSKVPFVIQAFAQEFEIEQDVLFPIWHGFYDLDVMSFEKVPFQLEPVVFAFCHLNSLLPVQRRCISHNLLRPVLG